MATKKPKVSGYVSEKVKAALRKRTLESGNSESSEVEGILEKVLDESTVVIQFNPQTLSALKEWAEADVRHLEGQIKWLVEKAVRDYQKNKD